MNDTLRAARGYLSAGLSVIPVRADGTKAPVERDWTRFSTRRPTDSELFGWFRNGLAYGIGIPGGRASGNLAVLDFETGEAFDRWRATIPTETVDLLALCPVVRTPSGGVHVWTRLPDPVPGTVLARRADKRTLIEVRGEGHQVLAPGCPLQCHKTGRPYAFIGRGWLDGPADPVPFDVWCDWTIQAAELNEYVKPKVVVGETRRRSSSPDGRPGDRFNDQVTWEAILTRHGWRACRSSGGTTYWTRPGKPEGVSATTGFCKGRASGDLLYVFSSSAPPFEPDAAYSRFAAYALLEHAGDFSAAARALGRAGYGQPTVRRGARG